MKTFKKLLAVTLSFIMMVSVVVVPVNAIETEPTADTVVTKEISILDLSNIEVGTSTEGTAAALVDGVADSGISFWQFGQESTYFSGKQEIVKIGSERAWQLTFNKASNQSDNIYYGREVFAIKAEIPEFYAPYVKSVSVRADSAPSKGYMAYRLGVSNGGVAGFFKNGKHENAGTGEDIVLTKNIADFNTYDDTYNALCAGSSTGLWTESGKTATHVNFVLSDNGAVDGGTGSFSIKNITITVEMPQSVLEERTVSKTFNLLDMSSYEVGAFDGTYPTGIIEKTVYGRKQFSGNKTVVADADGNKSLQLDLGSDTFSRGSGDHDKIIQGGYDPMYQIQLSNIPASHIPYISEISLEMEKSVDSQAYIIYNFGVTDGEYYSKKGSGGNVTVTAETTGNIVCKYNPTEQLSKTTVYYSGSWQSAASALWDSSYTGLFLWLSANVADGAAAGTVSIKNISYTISAPASLFAQEGTDDTGIITLDDFDGAAEKGNTFDVQGNIELAQVSTGFIGSFDVVLPEGLALNGVTLGKGVTGFVKLVGNTVFVRTDSEVGVIPFSLNLKAETVLENAIVSVANDEFNDYEGNYGFDVSDTANVSVIIHENSGVYAHDGNSHWKICTVEGCDEQYEYCGWHTWDYRNYNPAPTCCEPGKAEYACFCGRSQGWRDLPATGEHTYVYVDNEDKKTHTRTCPNTGISVTEEHTFADGACSLCQASEHKANTEVWETNSTYHWHPCVVEGCDEQSDYWWHGRDIEVLTPATCQSGGRQRVTCPTCERSFEEPTDKIAHDYSVYVDNKDGTHSLTCSMCGEVSATEKHTTVKGTCSVCKAENTVSFKARRALMIIEPWGVIFQGRMVNGHENSIAFEEFSDYGFYVLPSYKAEGAEINSDYVIANGKEFTKADCPINEDGYFEATYKDNIYTYLMDADIYYVAYAVVDSEIIYSGMGTTTLNKTASERIEKIGTPADEKEQAEVDLLNAMTDFSQKVSAYRNSSEYDTTERKAIPKVTAGKFANKIENTKYLFGTSYAIMIIEPWGIQFRSRIVDKETRKTLSLSDFKDYGYVILKADKVDGDLTVDQLIANENAQVISKSNDLATKDGNTEYFMGLYDDSIFTYQLGDNYYYARFVETDEGVIFESSVQTVSVETVINKRLDKINGIEECAVEAALLESMKNLYAYTDAYRYK